MNDHGRTGKKIMRQDRVGRKIVIGFYFLIIGLSLLVTGAVNISEGKMITVIYPIIFSGLLLIEYIIYLRTGSQMLVNVLFFVTTPVFSALQIFTGGNDGFALYWLFMSIPCIFYMLDMVPAIILNYMRVVLLMILMWVPAINQYIYPYPEITLRRYPIVYLLTTICCHVIQYLFLRTLEARDDNEEIIAALTQDFLNVFLLNTVSGLGQTIKMEGYVTTGIETRSAARYPFHEMVQVYVQERVYREDRALLTYALSAEGIQDNLEGREEYSVPYRILENDEIHYYEAKIIKKDHNNNYIVGFQNIDSLMQIKNLNSQLQEHNSRLEYLAEIDSLTGTYNRRGGDRRAQEILEDQDTRTAAVIALDIDFFKNINDKYGHAVGDLALKRIVEDMKKAFGESGVYIRNGGDEFLILLTNWEKEKMVARIREFAGKPHCFFYEGEEIRFSVSCGFAMYPTQAERFKDLCRCADLALYYAKENGRMGYREFVQTA